MSARLARLLVVVICLAALAEAPAGDAPPLRHDPFSRPPSDAIDAHDHDGSGARDRGIVLTATLVSTTERMAHVNGAVLRPGDEISGSKLLRVYEDRAVFLVNGEEATVFVKPTRDKDDEQN